VNEFTVLVEMLRDFRRENREDNARIHERVDQVADSVAELKTAQATHKGWLAGALAVGSAVGGAIGWLLSLAPVVLLAGCAALPPPAAPAEAKPGPYTWDGVTDLTVTLDSKLPEDCAESMDQAITFWGQYTDKISLVRLEDLDDRKPGIAEITVTSKYLGVRVGQTGQYATLDGHMLAAAIDLDPNSCTSQVVAFHELGHALGLIDQYGLENEDRVMFSNPTRNRVTEDEAAWVR
jgi:hypothetical protein